MQVGSLKLGLAYSGIYLTGFNSALKIGLTYQHGLIDYVCLVYWA
jgi:hypothetical protein